MKCSWSKFCIIWVSSCADSLFLTRSSC